MINPLVVKNLLLSVAALQAIASANPDGFTIDKKTLQPIKKGFAVAVAATQNSFNEAGAKTVIQYAKTNKEINAVGGWYNSENGRFYFDAVIICDNLRDAVILGKKNKQIAVFNLGTLEEIRL